MHQNPSQKLSNARALYELFNAFFRIGFMTFGGGYAMIPFIRHTFTEQKKWITDEDMVDILALSQSLPGIIAINSSIFIGFKIRGLKGGVAAAVGTIMPAFLSILLVLMVLIQIQENPYVQMVFTGIKATSAALILDTALKMARKNLNEKFDKAIATIAFGLIALLNLNAAWGILLGAVSGLLYFRHLRHTPAQ